MLKSYNQKIIETPTYIEIWEYEKLVIYKIDEKKAFEYEHESPEWIKNLNKRNRKFDDLSAKEQYDSLKRKSKHYRNMRFEIARLVDENFDKNTKFLTLTFKENIQDIAATNDEFKKFIKRRNPESNISQRGKSNNVERSTITLFCSPFLSFLMND